MRDKTIRAFVCSSLGLICGLCFACAGGVTPAHDQDLDDQIAAAYGDGAPVNAAGSGNAGTGGSGATGAGGTGTSANAPTGAAGSAMGNAGASSGTSAGGSASVGTGAAGSSSLPGSGGTAAGGGACDGFAVLSGHCSGGSCHGSPSPGTLSNFAFSEDSAKGFVDKQSTMCSATDNASLLDPEKPASSLIIKKANGSSSCGSQMPLGGTPLSAADLSCLQEWIGGL
jgi:hypothetical protein